MRVLVAPDKFRFACGAGDAAAAMARGVRAAGGEALELPLADGGEGTLDAVAGLAPHLEAVAAADALGRPVRAEVRHDGRGGYWIESARVLGLARIEPAARDPLAASSVGLAPLVRHALDRGATSIHLGLGGSATVDGGAGLAWGLGVRFFGDAGELRAPGGGQLGAIRRVDASGRLPRLAQVDLVAWCDVAAPLVGPGGAALRYGPQKGASPEVARSLDRALAAFAAIAEPHARPTPGDGAAGGLGFGIRALLGGRLAGGAHELLDRLGVDRLLAHVDLVLTGEGHLDAQTADGKLVAALAARCAAAGVRCVALVGRAEPRVQVPGLDRAIPLGPEGRPDPLATTLVDLEREARRLVQAPG